ncbi:carbohydrate-binding module family 1 protein [Serpula lacrymans var. lacrymans S7.3]|uniref:Carbohydrate-binding module family 1 protein n=1 Tax=Serpula lacrymans var. lacrymans (strain S7.3) TaxID=936435 RepID=F8PY89_SERL3|nr:carbohydrate-binding module family 1 protein [Serpula lacrymans var. lacrymans S7.3]
MAIANRLPILFALIVFATAQSAAYEQCGVQGWTGLATCVSGYVCTYNNAFYSQRLPRLEDIQRFGSCAAAIELTGNENPTRVYYQNKDDNIHELCGNGPLSTTYSDNVITVARNIRSNTPIAAISWYNFQQIRVYYITNTNEVAEAVFDVDRWVAGNQQLGIAAPNSGLLCAIVDPQSTIRVCFQSASDPETITEALWTMTVAGEWTTDIANIS